MVKNIVFADVTNTKIFRDNKGNKKDTATMSAYIERSGYDLGDPQSVKFVSAVYPQIEVSGDNTVNVYIGRQKKSEDTRLNSSHTVISYAVFCLKKKKKI